MEQTMSSRRVLAFSDLRPQKGVPFTRQHLRRMVKDGSFPAPIELGPHRIGWLESSIDEWLQSRPERYAATAPREIAA